MAKFKRDNYIHIEGWMITDLKLSGNELLCFAIIRGITQDDESEFYGGLTYLASALNITKPNAHSVVERLQKKGLVIKREEWKNGVKFCSYKISNTVIETVTGSVIETVTNNKIEDIKENTLFPEENKVKKNRGTSENLCLFENSRYNDFDEFKKCFVKEDYKDIDIAYYFECVKDWSAAGGKKKRDWIATARNFMRADREKGKLKTIRKDYDSMFGLPQGAIDYLKMGSDE